MPQTAKPFDKSLKLEKLIFKPNPNMFNVEDLNRELDTKREAAVQLSRQVGLLRENWLVNQKLQKDSLANDGTYTFDTQITIIKVDDTQPAYVYARGVRFELPTGDQISYTGKFTAAKPVIPVAHLVLVASRKILTYTDDTVLCGVTSPPEYPGSLPSVDAVVYRNERVVYTDNPDTITLGSGEENIGILATITFQDTSTAGLKFPTGTSGPISSILLGNPLNPFVFKPAFTRWVRYNAFRFEDVVSDTTLMNQYGDNFIVDAGFSDSFINPPQPEKSNKGISDMWCFLTEFIKRKFRYTELYFVSNNKAVSDVNVQLTTLTTTVNKLQALLSSMGSSVQVPLGGIIGYNADLTLFDTTGLGLSGTPMERFAIMNGKNGTEDWRGRFPVGAIQVPSVGAPGLFPEVDPSNQNLPANTNPSYTVGATGGAAGIALTVDQLPSHSHGTGWNRTSGGSGDSNRNCLQSGADRGELVTTNTGGGKPHSNLPPYAATCWIKRVK